MKPFVDYLPDWIDDLDLNDPSNYKYQFAIECFHKRQQFQALFPKASQFGEWVVTDKTGEEETVRIPAYRMPGTGWLPRIEEAFPRMLERQNDKYATDKDGVKHYYFRFSVGCNPLDVYAPQSPETIELNRKKRALKKLDNEVTDTPLFASELIQLQSSEREVLQG